MVTVTKDLIDVSVADTTTGWSGTSGQLDSEAFKQGVGAYTYQTGKNTLASCTFTPAANINMTASYTSPHLYWTMRCDVFPFTELLNTGATNSGLMVRVTDGSGNYTQWHIAGKDTWDGSWKNFILDLTNSTNVHSTSGVLSLTDVDIITWYTDNSNSGTIRIIDNTWLDAVRYGEGLSANSATTEDISFQDIADDDFLTANYYGVIQEKDGVLFCQGNLKLGAAATTTNFVSSGETVYFLDRIVSTSHYGISGIVGTATNITITNLVCKTVGSTSAELDFSTSLTSFSMDGCTFINMGTIQFAAGSVSNTKFTGCGSTDIANGLTFTSNTWDLSGIIDLNSTAIIDGCSVIKSNDSSAVLTSNLDNVTDCIFTSSGTGHAVEVTALGSGTMEWSNQSSGYAGTNGSTGNETIYVNFPVGTLTINVPSGVPVPTIRTAGATVTVLVNAVTTLITVISNETGLPILNARVRLLAEGGGSLPFNTVIINATTDILGQVADVRSLVSDQPVSGWVRMGTSSPYYREGSISGTISSASGLTLTIQLISDE